MTLTTERSGNVQCLEYTGHWTPVGVSYLNSSNMTSFMEAEAIHCSQCPKTFFSHRQLNNHSRVHLPFNITRVCDTCKVEFFTNGLHPKRRFCSRKCLFKWHDSQPARKVKKFERWDVNRKSLLSIRKNAILRWVSEGRKPGFDLNECNPLPNLVNSVMLGSMLGDGHIQFKYKRNLRYMEAHCIKQLDYLKWKSKIYGNHFICQPLCSNGHGPSKRLCFSSIDLYPYHDLFYKTGEKKITHEILSKLDLVSLLVWYLDDGTLCKKVGKYKTWFEIRIHNYQIDKSDTDYVKKKVEEVTELPVVIRKAPQGTNKEGITITFSASNSLKLLTLFRSLGNSLNIPQCMNYKFGGD